MTYVYIFLLMVLSYFLGSIPSGLIIGKVFKNIDIREFGSKNTGATNAVRVLGFRYGIFAFIFDSLKGALVILLVFLINDPSLYLVSQYQINISSIYGAAAVLGHVFPIYINFKGGKAVATSAGMIFAIEPWVAVGVIILFLIMFMITRYVSLSSTIAASSVLVYFIIRVFLEHELFNFATRIMDLVIVSLLATLIFIRHKANYRRLKLGTEYKFVPRKQRQTK
ncbi:MAG: acyl-phosphate glycerol 3-phosphate acyltransferase [Tenericutes bacterium GWC2_34_14]|nr:MAG: acyl-phosphate glycerol 3-phosphate acyltransferase [Tenericutes bacterium GWA2_35_7]OHE29491.1 MAG: acyl-phosphate glycerol 3-phosphate acyltransferase [Tenericutes bacterium GWC2_34_14]OHE34587.1 MAG: acyl-phosphate glycerol 3-phosphate acyltransferase [Tenericutes bacterium GWE2_34_108]OHE35944.1 MAG: acyl-phosphate glycerol 3-phosphate acyltransferase [Tenericutes bacterium GWF1_35_14]OHE38970.1 MAG: acyl-phosphate glycerol 3-phosphate acyltransferase [Tenericutes bacterium GWF2_35_